MCNPSFVRDDMEMFSKIVLLVFAFYWCMFGSETDEAECLDRWPFCYIYNPPCINNTDHLCPKQCGLCTSSENDTHSANMTCEDKVDDCSSFNLSEGCQSNNTWYREHCRNSCNMCLSDNGTREDGSKIRDQDSRNNVYHTSVKDALEAECIDRWPYCYVFNPPCLNHTDNELEVRVWCPKQCGLCSHQETDMQSADTTCRDKFDCSPFNLSEECQSNNTWYRQYCRLSCNVCLSDNGTTERRETDDEDSTPHIGSNISHTSTNDALDAESVCKDDQVCTEYLLRTNCLSNKTWFMEHCPKSCNVCQTEMPSTTDTITTVDYSVEDISLILNIAKSTEYTYHTSNTVVNKDNTFATSVTAAIIASGITFTVTLAAVLLCRKQGLCDAHTHERQPDHDQSHSVVQMTANMGVECCPEHNTNIYDEIGNVNAYEDHKASTDNSKYKMLIIRNMDGHSDTVTYLHPFDDPTYTQSLEDEHPLRMFNTDSEK